MAVSTVSPAATVSPVAVEDGWGRTRRSYAYWAYNYRRTWRGTAISSVAGPVLYLAAMGLGLGGLVDKHGTARIDGVRYVDFIGPALVAAAAMQLGSFESTWPILGAIKWQRAYHAMLASPLTVTDVLRGHLLWIATRIAMSAGVYLAVVAAVGAVASWAAILVLPAATLVGLAFAVPIAAYSATVDNDQGFAILYRFAIVPLFLFSGTFFPVSQLPGWLRPIAYVTPLWHGTSLCRDLGLGRAGAVDSLVHVGYLLLWVAAGVIAARRTFQRRLVV